MNVINFDNVLMVKYDHISFSQSTNAHMKNHNIFNLTVPIASLIKVVSLACLLIGGINTAHAVDRWKCNSGLLPKFENNVAKYYIEPDLWDDREIRADIINAFEEWNLTTGWKMKFQYARGNSPGSYGDRVFQVRAEWGGSTYTAKSVAAPTGDSGQCSWYDNDIVLNNFYLRNSRSSAFGQRSLYRVMLHEIGHAVGVQHSEEISAVNLSSGRTSGLAYSYYDGLFGHDIGFIRRLYGYSSGNVKQNLRADSLINDNGILRSFFIVKSKLDGHISTPYTVTNEGTQGELVKIEFLLATDDNKIYDSNVQVMSTVYKWIEGGTTKSGYVNHYVDPYLFGRGASVGFRIAESDANIWDNIVATGLL